MISEEINMTRANSAFVCCDMVVRSLYLFQEKWNVSITTFHVRVYMEYGAVGDPWRNSKWKQFRLFRIVKIVNLRSGGPSSILVWRLGEKDAWYFIFSLSLRKKTPDRRLENSGKNMQRFFFPLEGFEKTIHCLWSKYSKPHVKVEKSYLIRHLILPLILIAKRCLLRFRWVATEEVHMGEAWGKNPLPCPFIWTSTPKSLVYIMSRKHHATDLKKFSPTCFRKINAMANHEVLLNPIFLSTNSNIFYFQQ